MDEMRFRTKFGRMLAAKFVSNMISKKFGCNVKLKFEELEITNDDNKIRFKIKCEGVAENKIILQLTD